jgi:hypothetical protein
MPPHAGQARSLAVKWPSLRLHTVHTYRNRLHDIRCTPRGSPDSSHRPPHCLHSARTSRSHIPQLPTPAQVLQVAMQQLLGHQRGLAPRCGTANRGRLPLRASAAASGSGSGNSDVKSARLSRILRQYESAGVWRPPAAAAAAASFAARHSCSAGSLGGVLFRSPDPRHANQPNCWEPPQLPSHTPTAWPPSPAPPTPPPPAAFTMPACRRGGAEGGAGCLRLPSLPIPAWRQRRPRVQPRHARQRRQPRHHAAHRRAGRAVHAAPQRRVGGWVGAGPGCAGG